MLLSPTHKGILQFQQITQHGLLGLPLDAQLFLHSGEQYVADQGELHDCIGSPGLFLPFSHGADLFVGVSKKLDLMLFLYQSFCNILVEVALIDTFQLQEMVAVKSRELFKLILDVIEDFEQN